MAETWIERKFADLTPEPLFDEPARTVRRENKPRRPRNVNRRDCPKCGQLTGIYVKTTRAHRPVLAWKRHWRVTGSGASLPCGLSETEVKP
jgi:hypothetical protein